MAIDDRLSDLLVDWEQGRRAGTEPSAEELCRDTPDLLAVLRESIDSLRATEWMFDRKDDSPLEDGSRAALEDTELPASHLTAEEFTASIFQSGVLSRGEIDDLRQRLAASDLPGEAREIASRLVSEGKLTRYQASVLLKASKDPLLVDNYVILDTLDTGGMGLVFKALHRSMNRIVALKLLPASLRGARDTVKRFQREIKAAASLSHPNIVAAFDAGESSEIAFLVLEYVEGNNLFRLVKDHGPLDAARAADYVRQAALGLSYLHARGIIHRDVKPANLIMGRDGRVKLLDMGLVRFASSEDLSCAEMDQELTQAGIVIGTVAYMSPEQALDTRSADHRSDVYSLGCTLYFLLTGRSLYHEETGMKTLLAHREQAVPSIRQFREDVPGSLDAVFRAMAAKRPADRLQSMDEVIDAIDACLPGLPSTTGDKPTPRPRLAGVSWNALVRSRNAQIAAGFAAAAVLLAVLVIRIKTDRGTTEIRVDDPKAKVEFSYEADAAKAFGSGTSSSSEAYSMAPAPSFPPRTAPRTSESGSTVGSRRLRGRRTDKGNNIEPAFRSGLYCFCSRWAQPCREMERVVDKLRAENWNITTLDVDEHRDLAWRLGVKMVPTVVGVVAGNIVEKHTGLCDETTLRAIATRFRDASAGADASSQSGAANSPQNLVETPIGDYQLVATLADQNLCEVRFTLYAGVAPDAVKFMSTVEETHRVRIRDAVLKILHGFPLVDLKDPELKAFKANLRTEINKLLPRPVIGQILVSDFQMIGFDTQKVRTGSQPATTQAAPAPPSLDRWVLQWVQRKQGRAWIDGRWYDPGEPPPASDFHIKKIALRNNERGIAGGDDSRLDVDGYARLAQLGSLIELELQSPAVTDGALKLLQNLTSLERLNLDNTSISDAGLAFLGKMKRLDRLSLNSTAITDAGLKEIAKLNSLNDPSLPSAEMHSGREAAHSPEISINQTHTTEAGAARLQEALPNCMICASHLYADVRTNGLVPLPPLSGRPDRTWAGWLLDYRIGNCDVFIESQAGVPFRRTEDLPPGDVRIVKLDFHPGTGGWSTPLAELVVRRLADLPQLRQVHFERLSVRAFAALRAYRQLNTLQIDSTDVTGASLAAISGLSELTALKLGGRNVGDDDLEHLKGLGKLRTLDVTGTGVTKAGAEKLHAALPQCHISKSAAELHLRVESAATVPFVAEPPKLGTAARLIWGPPEGFEVPSPGIATQKSK